MSNQSYNSRYILPTLMLTVVIDMMGFGLVFPLLSTLFMPGSTFISIDTNIHLRYIYYSLAVSLWPIGSFFGTPYLGELSDKFGRRNILSICLFMTGISYALSAVSIITGQLGLFFISRIISGFFGGCYDIAQAATADISTQEHKARNMGWMTVAVSLGMIIGPAIAGFTSDTTFLFKASITTPFWIACTLAIINAILVHYLFKETYRVAHVNNKIQITKVFSSFTFIFSDIRVRKLGLIFLFLNIGWGIFITSIPLILSQKFHFDTRFTGLFFCFIGLGSIVSILFIQKKAIKLFSLKNIYTITTIISSIIVIFNFFYPMLNGLWLSAFLFALFEVLCYSSCLAMNSNAVTENLQGRVMGGLGAVTSISLIISSIILPILTEINILLPLLGAAVAYLLSTSLMFTIKQK